MLDHGDEEGGREEQFSLTFDLWWCVPSVVHGYNYMYSNVCLFTLLHFNSDYHWNIQLRKSAILSCYQRPFCCSSTIVPISVGSVCFPGPCAIWRHIVSTQWWALIGVWCKSCTWYCKTLEEICPSFQGIIHLLCITVRPQSVYFHQMLPSHTLWMGRYFYFVVNHSQ